MLHFFQLTAASMLLKGYQVCTFASSHERKFKEIPVALVVLLSYHFIDSCGVCL